MTRIQETAKWLFATIGAIAVALLAGVRYADVSRAQAGTRLLLVLLTLLTLACILEAIWNTGRVLAAKPVTLSKLKDHLVGEGGYIRPATAYKRPQALLTRWRNRSNSAPNPQVAQASPIERQAPTLWDGLTIGGEKIDRGVIDGWENQRLNQARLVREARDAWWKSSSAEKSVQHVAYVIETAKLEAYDEALTVVEAIGQFGVVKDTYNVAREWVIAATLMGFLTLTAAVNLIPAQVPA